MYKVTIYNNSIKSFILSALFMLYSLYCFAVDNQNIIASNYHSGNYSIAKITAQKGKSLSWELTKRPWPVEIKKADNKVEAVLIKRAGVIDELYKPDIPNFPAYFNYESTRITFINGVLVYYTWKFDNATIKYILAPAASDFEKISKDNLVKELEKYVQEVFKNQTAARTEVAAEREAAAEAERAKYSIKNKDLKSLKIKFLEQSHQIGHFTKIYMGIEATLSNGDKLSTSKLGGKTTLEDFEISCEGCDIGDDWIMVKNDCKGIPNDRIRLNIKSKYHNISDSKTLTINYNTPVTVNYGGQGGCGEGLYAASGGGGGHGKSLDIYVQATNNKQSGDPLFRIEIRDINGKPLHRFKVQPGVSVRINVPGGNGCSGRNDSKGQGGKGGSGGRGGNVNIYKNGACQGLSINVNNSGGRGGKGGKGSSTYNSGASGSNGTSGSTLEQSASFTLDF